MRVIEGVRRSGVGVGPDATIRDAALAMETSGVGALAIIDDGRPVGMVTDRDLVRRALARGVPPDARVDSVMSAPVVTIDADADLHSAVSLFRDNGVRRLAVVSDGRFVGVLALDDLLIDMASDLADLSRPITGEVLFPHHDGTVPAPVRPA